MTRLDITDRDGCITKKEMRALFEGSINQTRLFSERMPLGAVTFNGEFDHYDDSNTDTMWLGFAIGMRCAERLAKAAGAAA